MTTVWVKSDLLRSRFHRTPDCCQLVKTPARGTPHQVAEMDLREIPGVLPCKTCYPDVPRVGVARRYCRQCNKGSARPCAHNGGVPVVHVVTTTYRSLLREPGDEIIKTIYVWPQHAHKYISH